MLKNAALFALLILILVAVACSTHTSMLTPTAPSPGDTIHVEVTPGTVMTCDGRNEAMRAYVLTNGKVPNIVTLEPLGVQVYINKTGAGTEVFDYPGGWCADLMGLTSGPEHRSVLVMPAAPPHTQLSDCQTAWAILPTNCGQHAPDALHLAPVPFTASH